MDTVVPTVPGRITSLSFVFEVGRQNIFGTPRLKLEQKSPLVQYTNGVEPEIFCAASFPGLLLIL